MANGEADRLARIEQVFDAIARAWSGGAPDPTGTALSGIPGSANVDTDTPFIRKLRTFANTLPPAEQEQLRILLLAAAAAGRQVAVVPQTGQQQAASDFLKALDQQLVLGATEALQQDQAEFITTITTTVTVAASHPWITC